MARKLLIDKKLEEGINALVRHGIRFSIEDGHLFIRWEDLEKYDRLCRERKLPRSVC